MALFGRVASPLTAAPPAPDLTVLCSKVTNPQAETENPNDIRDFCDAVNQTHDGPQRVVRIVVPKMQSLNEREALYTLNLVDACVQSCGVTFHVEIGKFRFLNEMIKLLSPKYLGATTPDRVKKRTIELLYGWSKGLPHEPKIKEAYEMLKQQGLITADPTYVDFQYEVSNSKESTKERARNPIFDDEDKNKLLTKLLQSKNKEDLEAANRLIKSMVKEDEEKLQKQYKRTEELDTIHNNIRLMTDMLNNYSKASSKADIDLIKELNESLVKFRPRVFQLAAETDENDESIGDILLASDELSSLLERYNSTVGNLHYVPPDVPIDTGADGVGGGLLDLQSPSEKLILDPLAQLDIASMGEKPSQNGTNPFAIFETLASQDTNVNTQQEVAGLSTSPFNSVTVSSNDLIGHTNPFAIPTMNNTSTIGLTSHSSPQHRLGTTPGGAGPPPLPNRPNNHSSGITPDLSKNMSKRTPQGMSKSGSMGAGGAGGTFGELDSLAKNWLSGGAAGDRTEELTTVSIETSAGVDEGGKSPDVPLIKEMVPTLVDTTSSTSNTQSSKPNSLGIRSHREDFIFYSIKPAIELKPMTLMNDSELGVSITANFTQFTKPPDETDETRGLTDIVVLTVTNSSSHNYSKVGIQAASPKSMRAVLGSSSGDILPAKTPFAPPTVLNQCLFIHNPNKVMPRLKLRISLTKDAEETSAADNISVDVAAAVNRVVDCSLDCLISESDMEFSDFS
ncbi:ADP-ribosylation factor-binding protein GGA2-like isoform X2 [Convolutriloba macropyga]|uniref:ADP-ribosylation factor-binding protein GGA2-like isoform X2 n=1 Tax=Convolutriloba macropyga TaxID=536237 RepID=UPI003F51B065